MATRQSQLQNQRLSSKAIYKIANSGRRVLSLSTVSNRIATTTQDALDADYTARYNDGLISPEEYASYLDTVVNRPGVSATDRVRLQSTIRTVKSNAVQTLLESNYAQSQPGTSERVAAARALSDHFKSMSSSSLPGTPTNSEALANAGKWDQQAVAEQNKIEANARKTARLQALAKISALDSSDPATAMKKAQLYKDLAGQALADGDQNEASQWEAKSNQEVQSSQDLAVKQTKSNIVNFLNENLDKYKDKKVGAYDMLNALNDAEKAADQTGDFALSIRIDNMRKTIQDDIKSAEGKGKSSFKKQANETLDTIQMDLSNLETAFRYGEPFKPESDFFKQYIKGEGVPSLEDMVTLRALGFSAGKDVIKQMEDNGIDVSESVRSSMESNFAEATSNRNAFTQGTLLAVVDPADGEVKLEKVTTPEEGSKYITDPTSGISFALINKNDKSAPDYFEKLQQAIAGGYASPEYAASVGTLLGQGGTIKQSKSFLGADWLAPDTKLNLDANTPLYGFGNKDAQTGAYDGKDSGYAVRESDIKDGGDPNKYLKVKVDVNAKTGARNLTVTQDTASPNFGIDPVIVAPSQGGGLDRIFVKKDPVTGQAISYYSQNMGGNVTADQLPNLFRGKSVTQPTVEPKVPDVTQPAIDPSVQTTVAPTPEPTPSANMSTPYKLASSLIPSGSPPSSSSFSMPSLSSLVPQFLKPTVSEKQSGASLAGTKYDTPIIAGKTASQVLNPTTFTDKLVSGGLKLGSAVQTQLQKIPLLGNLFK